MDVSIIIINYKTPDLVIDCVRSIEKLTKDISYEIIVVDNASNDDSVDIMRKELEEDIILLESENNLGFGKANNLGVQHAMGEYVLLLNSDTVLINNAVKILHDYIKDSTEVGVVGGNLYSTDLKENSSFCMKFDDIESIRKRSKWINVICDIFTRQLRQKFYNEEQKRKYTYKHTFNYTNNPMEVGYVFGTDMMLPRNLYNQMGGFDPEFFMYAEEEELSWRIHQAGYKIFSVPMAKIIHLDGGTFKRDDSFNSRQFGMRMMGAMLYYKKRFGLAGMDDFYYYKMTQLKRKYKLANMMNRQMLLDLTKKQMDCLEMQYSIMKREK